MILFAVVNVASEIIVAKTSSDNFGRADLISRGRTSTPASGSRSRMLSRLSKRYLQEDTANVTLVK